MGMSDQLALFDYAALDPETRIVVQQRTDEIKTLVRRTAQDIIDIGQKIADVKTRLAHGQFSGWLDVEFGWSDQTARRFMHVAKHFQNQQIVGFEPSALYLLAAPNTPESARIEAVERAESGEQITHAKAQEIVSEHKSPTPIQRYVPTGESEAYEEPAVDYGEPVLGEDYDTGHDLLINEDGSAFDLATGTTLPAESSLESSKVNRAYKNSSESNEWYTPQAIIDLATAVMGRIDLDPASSEAANKVVQAGRFYTIEDNALLQEWGGKVWLNPPYGDAVDPFVDRLVKEYEKGSVREAILLVAARTDTQWFRKLRKYSRCFIWGRIKFVSGATGESGDPAGFPSMAVYLGSNTEGFIYSFKEIGDIYALWGSNGL